MPGVTKEQIQAAREADLFAYLQFHEPGVLKRDGPNYRHKEHDSLVYVTGKRYWYWNSRGRSSMPDMRNRHRTMSAGMSAGVSFIVVAGSTFFPEDISPIFSMPRLARKI